MFCVDREKKTLQKKATFNREDMMKDPNSLIKVSSHCDTLTFIGVFAFSDHLQQTDMNVYEQTHEFKLFLLIHVPLYYCKHSKGFL